MTVCRVNSLRVRCGIIPALDRADLVSKEDIVPRSVTLKHVQRGLSNDLKAAPCGKFIR